MKNLSLALIGSLAMCGAAFAEEKPTTSGSSGSEMQKTDKMTGPPNADGAAKSDGKADTTGTAGGGAAAAKSTGEAEGGSGQKK